eukprot:TRINITY_DN5832_c0_g2_i1.p1 TRINITY_DN5832_c0_g2~~TRINITY_DN5832_c0_g2_i1.p1  ORF type:complete len:169 (+),score=21.51 TRINITY_DN5832_c0_g2_i1:75-509(+)
MAARDVQLEQEYAHGLCAPTLECCLACFGLGCIPVYTIIVDAAPIEAVFVTLTADTAILWALLFGLGTCYAAHETVIFALLYICFCLGVKKRLRIQEEDVMLAIKAFCCGPCIMGQLASTVRHQKHQGRLSPVGEPVTVEAVNS